MRYNQIQVEDCRIFLSLIIRIYTVLEKSVSHISVKIHSEGACREADYLVL